MKQVTFITGNPSKAEYLERYLGCPIDHQKVEQDELQSLDLREIVTHKARQAYELLRTPVLVEDTSLEFTALGRLPGPFIKFFLQEMSEQTVCDLLEGKDRSAVARGLFAYTDGNTLQFFEGSLLGKIAYEPAGDGGFGWDRIFIPDGYDVTRAQLGSQDDKATYLKIKPLQTIKEFLLR